MAKKTKYSGGQIAEILFKALLPRWDGMQCVLDMQLGGDPNWPQMEWIGWWFEYKAKEILSALGAKPGSAFGSVKFDCFLDGVWDFKSHPIGKKTWAYLNDEEAVDACLKTHSHLGWLIAIGQAEYDTTGFFKTWHDALKGKPSAYVLQGQKIGRKSRRRKSAFNLEAIVWVEFHSKAELSSAISAGWIRRGMQQGQQNSNGTPRKPKYGFSLNRWRTYSGPLKGGQFPP